MKNTLKIRNWPKTRSEPESGGRSSSLGDRPATNLSKRNFGRSFLALGRTFGYLGGRSWHGCERSATALPDAL